MTAAALQRRLESTHAELVRVCEAGAAEELGGAEGLPHRSVLQAALLGLRGAVANAEAALAQQQATRGLAGAALPLATAPDAVESNSLKRLRPACLEGGGPAGPKRSRHASGPAATAGAGASSGQGAEGGSAAAGEEAEPKVPEAAPLVGVGEGKKAAKRKGGKKSAPASSSAATGAGETGTGAGQLAGAGAGAGAVAPSGQDGAAAAQVQGGGPAPRAPPPARKTGQPQALQHAASSAPAATAAAGLPLEEAMSFPCPNMDCAPRGQAKLTLRIEAGQTEVKCLRCHAIWNRARRRKMV